MADFSDFDTGPGTKGGNYLRMFWHPVFRAADLQRGRAVPIRIMGENYTLYRADDGGVHLADALCPHRGTKLSTGWVEGDAIRCLYHGWKFDRSGQCVERPGEEPALAAKMKIRVFPAQEYLGLIFGYFGTEATPAMPRFPELEQEGVLETDPPEPWPCHFLNRLDNDLAHVPWTHKETMTRFNRFISFPPGAGQTYRETEFGLADVDRFAVARVMPNMSALRVPAIGDDPRWHGMFQDRLIFVVPIDDENSVAYDLTFVPGLVGSKAQEYLEWRQSGFQGFSSEKLEEYARLIIAGKMTLSDLPSMNREESFMVEDYVTQVGQGHPKDRPMENLGKNDATVIQYRRVWRREVDALVEGRPLKQWSYERIWESYKQTPMGFKDRNVA